MKRYFIILMTMVLSCICLRAQEEEKQEPEPPLWVEVTNLYYAAHNCTDESKVLQQYMLIPAKSFEENQALFEELKKFNQEFNQIFFNEKAPEHKQELKEDSAEGAENLKEMIKMLRENPDLAAQSGVNISELEAELAKFNNARRGIDSEYDSRTTSQKHLTVNPASIWRRLYALTVNHKVYTAKIDLGNGLQLVNETPRYCTLAHYSFDKETFSGDGDYEWFFMDENGRHLSPAQYCRVSPRWDVYYEWDMVIVSGRDADGNIKTGAVDYKGRLRIPLKYKGCGGFYNNMIMMLRFDGDYDAYSRSKIFVRRMPASLD